MRLTLPLRTDALSRVTEVGAVVSPGGGVVVGSVVGSVAGSVGPPWPPYPMEMEYRLGG